MKSAEFINEESPDTLSGSFTKDLIASKIWLCKKMQKHCTFPVQTIYVLGSWYGNLALLLARFDIDCQEVVLVDTNRKVLQKSKQLLKDRVKSICHFMPVDAAQDMVYRTPGVVINTSVNDMPDSWYQLVPDGMPVIAQARDNLTRPVTKIDGIKTLDSLFPMSKIEYQGIRTYLDPETRYRRFMTIGIK